MRVFELLNVFFCSLQEVNKLHLGSEHCVCPLHIVNPLADFKIKMVCCRLELIMGLILMLIIADVLQLILWVWVSLTIIVTSHCVTSG
jgi:hypothetical protein